MLRFFVFREYRSNRWAITAGRPGEEYEFYGMRKTWREAFDYAVELATYERQRFQPWTIQRPKWLS
jgi:hypothetical protein